VKLYWEKVKDWSVFQQFINKIVPSTGNRQVFLTKKFTKIHLQEDPKKTAESAYGGFF